MTDFLERLSRGFFQDRPMAWGVLIAVLAMIALALVLHMLLASRFRGTAGTRRLFRDLAEASGLSAAERRLLFRLAQDCRLENPALIFFRRSLFEVDAPDRGVEGARAEAIRRKVYGP